MAMVRVRDRRGCRDAGFGRQPVRCQVQSSQGALPAIGRAVSIDPAQHAQEPGRNDLKLEYRRSEVRIPQAARSTRELQIEAALKS